MDCTSLAFGNGHGYGHLCELYLSVVNNIKFDDQFNDSVQLLGIKYNLFFFVV